MNLVIVESPTKSKTIQSFLGKNYKVLSSFGHIRDLPKSSLGVDIEKNFEPKYVIPSKAKPKVKILKDESEKAKEVILATDEDREGEAIAWHLAEVLKLKNPKRIVFHEITKNAINEALESPRTIDLKLVNAQQARRILDRLVGYKLSPLLWKKIMRGLSAGRVQSVAVRLICDREKEIKNFVAVEYWNIEAKLFKDKEFLANLVAKNGKPIEKLEIKSQKEADKILQELEGAQYIVENVEKKETQRNPYPPFTTSTLQQTAVSKFGWGAKRTMAIAQKLYEKGHITYHRTDSLNLSVQSQALAKQFIIANFGKNYWPGFARTFKTKSQSAQEAHEAIRPTFPANTPEQLKQSTKPIPEEFKLYDLIWRRFIASQMEKAVFDSCSVDIKANASASPSAVSPSAVSPSAVSPSAVSSGPNCSGPNCSGPNCSGPNCSAQAYTFRANGQTLKFNGFLRVYPVKFEEMDLPVLKKGEVLELKELTKNQHFTQPPARYSEATLIKVLEKEGIGRPSTYAPILDTIQQRNYVEKDENKRLKPTQTGIMVNEMLEQHFPQIVDIQFTAKMEKELDEIARGKDTWQSTLKDFYMPFEQNLKQKEKTIEKMDLTEETNKICPKCQSQMVIRLGRFGKFYACSGFPNCKHTEPLPKPTLNIECPKCGQGEIMEKTTRSKKTFFGCSNWPKCDFALWDKPINEFCPECRSIMVETKRKQKKCSNPKCASNINARLLKTTKKKA